MKKISFVIISLLALTASTASAQRAGEDRNPPKPSESDQKVKPPICDWVCVSYNRDGSCAKQEYQCH
jgi:hypothetical protein